MITKLKKKFHCIRASSKRGRYWLILLPRLLSLLAASLLYIGWYWYWLICYIFNISTSIYSCRCHRPQLISDQIEENTDGFCHRSHLPSRMATQFVPCGRSYDQKKPLVFAAEGAGHVLGHQQWQRQQKWHSTTQKTMTRGNPSNLLWKMLFSEK